MRLIAEQDTDTVWQPDRWPAPGRLREPPDADQVNQSIAVLTALMQGLGAEAVVLNEYASTGG